MPAPRVFVSSTAYDFGLLRGQLRSFIGELGLDPVLSEYSDILYDPRTHTHVSCVKEVPGCDLVVLVLGGRFGSTAIPEAILSIDSEQIERASSDVKFLSDPNSRISVTQLEVLKAVEEGLPVFAFVDERVLHDHATYEANRDQPFAQKMRFTSIGQPEYAEYIFGFISFLRGRLANNAIFGFSRIEDIENQLRKQWAGLFQRLLEEQREQATEQQRIDRLSEQFEDLKAAILTTIGDAPSRDIARGVVNYRSLIDTLRALEISELRRLIEDGAAWPDVMSAADVIWPDGISGLEEKRSGAVFSERVVIERQNRPTLRGSMSANRFRQLPNEWEQFLALPTNARLAIYDALGDVRNVNVHRMFSPLPPPPPPPPAPAVPTYDYGDEPF